MTVITLGGGGIKMGLDVQEISGGTVGTCTLLPRAAAARYCCHKGQQVVVGATAMIQEQKTQRELSGRSIWHEDPKYLSERHDERNNRKQILQPCRGLMSSLVSCLLSAFAPNLPSSRSPPTICMYPTESDTESSAWRPQKQTG